MTTRRKRRNPEVARQEILEAAEKRLIAEGPAGVRVQAIARDLGLTDAAIHHHFGSRDQLMKDLLRFGGRQLRDALRNAGQPGDSSHFDLERFVEGARAVFADRGYSRLALWLDAAGWRSAGTGLFDELAREIANARQQDDPDEDARQLAALMALVLMGEPVFGQAARRSVSLPGDTAAGRRMQRFTLELFEALIHRGP